MGSRKPKSSKRKSSKALKTKRSRRSKSHKKPSRHEHSISSYLDDDSVSSVSSYSSSSDEDHRSRKGRSRSRAEVKNKKKKSERRVSSDRGSSEDSIPSRKRKRKSSKRKHNSEYKKSQKKRRRDASISESLSCSSFHDSSNGEESEFESPRVRHRKKIREKRGSDKHKVRAKRSRSKSVNSPSSEDHSNFHSVSQKGEEHESENNVRRVRSVITVVEHPQENEENQIERDRCNEENVSKNNDSDNGSREIKLEYHSGIVSDKTQSVQDITVQESVYEVRDGPTKSAKNEANHHRNQADAKSLGESEKKVIESDNMVSVNAINDLELILRQKALENLIKFRGKIQAEPKIIANQKANNDPNDNQPPFVKSEIVHKMLPKQDGSNASIIGQSSRHGSSKEVLHPTEVESKNAAEEYKKAEDRDIKHDESETSRPRMQHDSLQNDFTLKQESPTANPLDGKTSAGNRVEIETTINGEKSPKAEPTSREEKSSKDQQAETNDSSQFQQKTMSVMRSGEMVQVSYKVYIPKRAPALARRQLKR